MGKNKRYLLPLTAMFSLALTGCNAPQSSSRIVQEESLASASENKIISENNNISITSTSSSSVVQTESDSLYYLLNDGGGSWMVTGMGPTQEQHIVIPEYYKGMPVTAIGDSAFSNNASIVSIMIPKTIKDIGVDVFLYCSSLENIEVSEANTAFKSIDGNLYSKDGTVFAQYAPGKTQTEFTVPNSVKTIAYASFCSDYLERIIIPDSVVTIGKEAFSCCFMLNKVSIGSGVTTIGEDAFQSFSIANIEVSEANKMFKSIDGNLYNKAGSLLINYALGKQENKFIVPDSVTSIGDAACMSASYLEEVIIGDNVTSIGREAFSWCYTIRVVRLGIGVTKIEEKAFFQCEVLKEVYYKGSEADKGKILIGDNNIYLNRANWHYNS